MDYTIYWKAIPPFTEIYKGLPCQFTRDPTQIEIGTCRLAFSQREIKLFLGPFKKKSQILTCNIVRLFRGQVGDDSNIFKTSRLVLGRNAELCIIETASFTNNKHRTRTLVRPSGVVYTLFKNMSEKN
jgi:hypothetical protein